VAPPGGTELCPRPDSLRAGSLHFFGNGVFWPLAGQAARLLFDAVYFLVGKLLLGRRHGCEKEKTDAGVVAGQKPPRYSRSASQPGQYFGPTARKEAPGLDQPRGRASAGARSRPADPKVVAKAGPSRLFAFRTDRVGGLAVSRVVTHLQGGIVHPQRHDERDDLEDDEGCDHIVHDDERRSLHLQ
jgi:hypothetical protein